MVGGTASNGPWVVANGKWKQQPTAHWPIDCPGRLCRASRQFLGPRRKCRRPRGNRRKCFLRVLASCWCQCRGGWMPRHGKSNEGPNRAQSSSKQAREEEVAISPLGLSHSIGWLIIMPPPHPFAHLPMPFWATKLPPGPPSLLRPTQIPPRPFVCSKQPFGLFGR